MLPYAGISRIRFEGISQTAQPVTPSSSQQFNAPEVSLKTLLEE